MQKRCLAGAGLDGVKVDCQAILGMVGGGTPGQGGGPAMSARYHAAMEDSVAHHFPGNNCINCMCHSTEDLYRWAAQKRPGVEVACMWSAS